MFILSFLICSIAGAVPHTESTFTDDITYSQVRRLVEVEGREEVLKKMGPKAYKYIREMMMSSNETVEERWKATLTLAKIGGVDSLPDLKSAVQHNDWFMRSAGLLAMALAEPIEAEKQARDILHSDPALLVRATALQVMAQSKKIDKDLLWSEIYNPINFNNGKSLPIRLSILKVLEKQLTATDKEKLTALMREDNKEIQEIVKSSLVKVNSLSSSASIENVSTR